MSDDTNQFFEEVMKRGPTRVVIDSEGSAVAPHRTQIRWEIVFIRDDGWSLGAPMTLASTAYELWKDHWVGKYNRGDSKVERIGTK